MIAFRMRGAPRDHQDGRHRQVVIFAAPTTTPKGLAVLLRSAAEALDPAR